MVVPVVCPSCDTEPPPGVTAGVACLACQSPLIAVSEPENLVGTVIDDRFEILDRLGAGGMGTVYRAKQRSIGRDVALKVMDRLLETDVVAVKRFLREAQVASALVHPNTVGVIEFGQSKTGRLYLVMELVRGKTLKDAAEKGPFDMSRAVRIGVQLCDALDAAHALGIIHRDLKLENVMLLDGPNDRDLVKILDFGLARRTVETTRATATGLIAGTPRYMAPEVALQNAEPAPPQDMYALGVLLGELVTGKSLWEGPTLEALFTAKLTTLPNLETVPAELRSVIMRLLDRNPENRPTAGAARSALLELGAPPRTSPVAFSQTLVLPESAASPGRPVASPKRRSPLHFDVIDASGPPTDVQPQTALAPIEPFAAPTEVNPPATVGTPVAIAAPVAIGTPIAIGTPVATPPAAFGPPASPNPEQVNSLPTSLPESAFEPPQSADQSIEIESDWQREKFAKANTVHRPRPRRSRTLWGAAVAVAMVAIAAAAVVYIGTSKGAVLPPHPHQLPATANTVSIAIRTRPPGQIIIDGRAAGNSPLTLHVPKSTTPLEISTTLQGHLVSRTVIPDRDQTVDITP